MHPETMAKRCSDVNGEPLFKEVGVARLRDHRLGFTIVTPNWGGPVGDIIPQEDFFLYGFLYEMEEEALVALDEAEYVSDVKYYSRRVVRVELVGGVNSEGRETRNIDAIVYQAGENRGEDLPPNSRYIAKLVDAALKRSLPEDYVRSLRSMDAHEPYGANGTLLALPNNSRKEGCITPVVQISPVLAESLRLRRFALVTFEERVCYAEVILDSDLRKFGRVCLVDETVRRVLGIPAAEPAAEFYGAFLRIERAPFSRLPMQIIPARSLLLKLEKTDYLDCERALC
ncbi:MAG: gamma-glutamylcyclotransferase family protein, partial [Acidobacteriota bacterium]